MTAVTFIRWNQAVWLPIWMGMVVIGGCTPTVKVEAPDKPIVINLNVKIEQQVLIKLEKELEEDFRANPDLFN